MKTNFHNKNLALSLAFIMRFEATRKWSIMFGGEGICVFVFLFFFGGGGWEGEEQNILPL